MVDAAATFRTVRLSAQRRDEKSPHTQDKRTTFGHRSNISSEAPLLLLSVVEITDKQSARHGEVV